MSRKRQGINKPGNIDQYASVNEVYFGRIYSSMLKSKSFQALSLGAKYFYCVCRAHARSEAARQCLYKHITSTGGKTANYPVEVYFVFPAKHLKEYNIKPSNACKYFKELETHGFIKKVEANQHRHKVNVYAFSHLWK